MTWQSHLIALLAASLVRPFALAAAAWLILRIFRVSHPASRHAVWTAVLIGMIFLPIMTVMTPHWKLPILPVKQVSPAQPVTPMAYTAPVFRQPDLSPDPIDPNLIAGGISATAIAWPSAETTIVWCYFAGLLAMAAYHLAGWILLWRILLRSRPLRIRSMRESGEILAPVAVGVLRPSVILPAEWRNWSKATKRAVLAHEFAHLHRRDTLISAITRLAKCLFWFHPLIWWLSRRISELSELSCDAAALAKIDDPAAYSRILIGFAEAVSRAGYRAVLPGLAMAAHSGMSDRIDQVFELGSGNMRKLSRPAVLLGTPVMCLAATIGFASPNVISPKTQLPPVVVPAQQFPQPVDPAAAPIRIAQVQSPPAKTPPAQRIAPPAPVANRPEFEVASIKPCREGDIVPARGRGGRGQTFGPQPSPGRLTLACKTVEELVQNAYVMFANGPNRYPSPQIPIAGGPTWIHSERYTIDAEGDNAQNRGMMNGPMLQVLLEDRFHLKIHRETREVPVYDLTVGKDGPKLQPFQEGDCIVTDTPPADRDRSATYCDERMGVIRGNDKEMSMWRVSLDDFCKIVLARLDRPVINKTGITGLFDIHLTYAREDDAESLRRMAETAMPGLREQMLALADQLANEPPGIPIFTAVERQLGLKLVSARGPGEFLVIDSVERPSEN